MSLIFWAPLVLSQDHWPQFRGTHAAGIAQNQNLPEVWDTQTGKHIAWKLALPGQSHASPITWDQTVFMVTAIGNQSRHSWEVWAVQLQTGEVLWRKEADSAIPDRKRRIHAAYAHATPVTDGKVVVAMFGSKGLHAFNMSGETLWRKNLGNLNLGAYSDPENEWGHGSSPILHKGKVIVQCDTSKEDFLVALDSQTGKEVWRVVRDELPSWGTPTWVPGTPNMIVANGSKFIRAYDASNGKELWRLGGSSRATAPTPIFTNKLILVASGERPERPIYAIKRDARGDLTLGEGKTSNDAVLWSKKGRGPYLPTPIIVGDLLYSINNNGVLDCYELATGAEVYRQRMPDGGAGFTAAPVASDGKLYFSSEGGDIFVVPAGRTFQVTATNSMDERIMATPAIANNTLLIRGANHLFAIRKE